MTNLSSSTLRNGYSELLTNFKPANLILGNSHRYPLSKDGKEHSGETPRAG